MIEGSISGSRTTEGPQTVKKWKLGAVALGASVELEVGKGISRWGSMGHFLALVLPLQFQIGIAGGYFGERGGSEVPGKHLPD